MKIIVPTTHSNLQAFSHGKTTRPDLVGAAMPYSHFTKEKAPELSLGPFLNPNPNPNPNPLSHIPYPISDIQQASPIRLCGKRKKGWKPFSSQPFLNFNLNLNLT